jgi:hypothetical protein
MANEMRDRLTEYIENAKKLYEGDVTDVSESEYIAECILSDGVIVPQWISVKDRLPETNGKYLATYYSREFKRYFLDIFYYDVRNKDEYFYCADNYKQRVDYWIPLPEPPQAEQKLKEMRGE